VLELLHMGGRSLPHAVLMMVPEAWENATDMDPAKRAFYEFHASVMEAWDGPACVTFTDGTLIGAVLDRNGLRPSRWWETADGRVVLASEVGVMDVEPSQVVRKGRLQPGKMFLVDTAQGRIVDDEEVKAELAAEHPYAEWLHSGQVHLADLPAREHVVYSHESVQRRQQVFGYTEEELRILLSPMARTGAEAIGSMGTDTPSRCCPSGPGCCSTTSASCSRRSPTRRSTPSARSWSPRSPARSGPSRTCSRRPRRRAASWCCRSPSSTTTSSQRS
jgi:glutamate synthase (NADPH/NADH) large chain